MVWHNILIINRPIPEKNLISLVYVCVCLCVCDPLCEIQAKVLI